MGSHNHGSGVWPISKLLIVSLLKVIAIACAWVFIFSGKILLAIGEAIHKPFNH